MKPKVVVAMSGGVDSAVAAYLIKEQGYQAIGVTLRLAPDPHPDSPKRTGRCCSIDDMIDARQVCEKLDIPFYAIDAQDKFKKTVFDPFVTAYKNGMTPIPCLACNHEVKFGDLFATAKKLGAKLATGHYARVVSYKNSFTIAKPYDPDRDQTYYLYGTNNKNISNLMFPLGEIKKPRVREIAQKIGLKVHDKKDSHEICFVPDGDHAKVVEQALNTKFSGDIVDQSGKYLGKHDGVHKYTIGQRRGLGIAQGKRVFVADIDAQNQKVILGARDSLVCHHVGVGDMRYLVSENSWPNEVLVKIRARSQPVLVRIIAKNNLDNELEFKSQEDLIGVALGQAAVFYDKDYMLGGGVIQSRLDGAFPRTTRNHT